MVLEAHVLLCLTARFLKKSFFAPKMEKMCKNRVFWIYLKIFHYFFLNLVYKKVYYLLYSCANPIFEKNLALDCRIFRSTVSLKQNDEKASFFACWWKFMETKSWLKNIGLVVVNNWCGHAVLRTQSCISRRN